MNSIVYPSILPEPFVIRVEYCTSMNIAKLPIILVPTQKLLMQ